VQGGSGDVLHDEHVDLAVPFRDSRRALKVLRVAGTHVLSCIVTADVSAFTATVTAANAAAQAAANNATNAFHSRAYHSPNHHRL